MVLFSCDTLQKVVDMRSRNIKQFTLFFSLFTVLVCGAMVVTDNIFFSFTDVNTLALLITVSLLFTLAFSLFTLYKFSGMTKDEAENLSYLKERNYMFEKFLAHTPIYVFFKDAEIRTLALSKNYEQMLGMPVENALGKTMDDLFPSDLAKSMIEDDKNILKKGDVFEVYEEMHERFYRTLKFPIKGDNDNKYLAGFTIDVTDLHTLEVNLREKSAELQKSVDEYNLIFNSMQDVFFRIDSEQRIKIISPSSQKVLGYSPDELKEDSFEAIFTDATAFTSLLKDIKESGEVEHYECELTTKDRNDVWVSINANSEKNAEGEIIHINGIIRDITAKRKWEEEKLKNQKIESISILAGGIAHDFNNVMTGVMGNVSLAAQTLNPASKEASYLAKAEEAMERANILSNQLLTFSSGGTPIKQECSLKELIEKCIHSAFEECNLTPTVSIAENLPPVTCDPIQISQAVNTLILNAIQAVNADGTIDISAGNHIQYSNTGVITKGNYIKISVKDNGCGIPSDITSRIFDPFFTTKIDANGLGLATAHSIIKKHDGGIEFQSEKSGGSIFSIFLPTSSIPEDTTLLTVHAKQNEHNKGQRLLIMDDEEIVLLVCEEMCKIIGFEVVTVTNGTMAIDTYKEALEQNRRFDLVIMDLTVPGGMGGKEAIAKLIEIDPDVKAIVSSGYSNEPIMSHYEKYGFVDAIAKPYSFSMFKETVTKHS